jgi:hypothetical protein
MISEAILDRARNRCSQRRDVDGFCPCCLEHVLAAALVEENPELSMDEAVNVVLEWIACGGAGRALNFGVTRVGAVQLSRGIVLAASAAV